MKTQFAQVKTTKYSSALDGSTESTRHTWSLRDFREGG